MGNASHWQLVTSNQGADRTARGGEKLETTYLRWLSTLTPLGTLNTYMVKKTSVDSDSALSAVVGS